MSINNQELEKTVLNRTVEWNNDEEVRGGIVRFGSMGDDRRCGIQTLYEALEKGFISGQSNHNRSPNVLELLNIGTHFANRWNWEQDGMVSERVSVWFSGYIVEPTRKDGPSMWIDGIRIEFDDEKYPSVDEEGTSLRKSTRQNFVRMVCEQTGGTDPNEVTGDIEEWLDPPQKPSHIGPDHLEGYETDGKYVLSAWWD